MCAYVCVYYLCNIEPTTGHFDLFSSPLWSCSPYTQFTKYSLNLSYNVWLAVSTSLCVFVCVMYVMCVCLDICTVFTSSLMDCTVALYTFCSLSIYSTLRPSTMLNSDWLQFWWISNFQSIRRSSHIHIPVVYQTPPSCHYSLYFSGTRKWSQTLCVCMGS